MPEASFSGTALQGVIMNFYCLLAFFLIFPVFSFSAEDNSASWFLKQDDKLQKFAFIPSYYRNATYGHRGGVRFFVYPSGDHGYYTSFSGELSEDLFFSAKYSYRYWMKTGSQWKFLLEYDAFPDPYYGEGSQTLAKDRKDIPVHNLESYLEYVQKVNKVLFAGVFLKFMQRAEKEKPVQFPGEWVLTPGVLLRYDSRDNYFNPTKGEYYQVSAWTVPQKNKPFFMQGDLRLFLPIASEKLILALRGEAGHTFLKSSSYLLRFHLGGQDKLRGFRLNRFHGEKYYLADIELRYSPWSFMTLAGFFSLGSAEMREQDFRTPRYSYGGGVRFGLPPDYNKKIRIEWGKGEDQTNFVVAFGHPF